MKKIKSYKLLIVLAFNCNLLSSQNQIDTSLLSLNDLEHHFFVIKPNITLSDKQFLSNPTKHLGLKSDNELYETSNTVDGLSGRHVKYSQKVKGVTIENSRIILHYDKNERLSIINGVVENNLGKITTTPSISSDNAIKKAIGESKDKSFLWMDEQNEKMLKEEKGDKLATNYPKALLMIIKKNPLLYNVPENYFLAYKVALNYTSGATTLYYINAHNGDIIKTENPVMTCFKNKENHDVNTDNVKAKEKNNETVPVAYNPNSVQSCGANCINNTANIYYYPSQYIFTEEFSYLGVCTHRLKEVCTSTWVYVKDNGSDFRDPSTVWANSNDVKGTTTFWTLSWTNRFWSTYFLRNSYDNNYAQITADVKVGSTSFNPSTGLISVGKINNNWAGSLDVMGHEFAHGVTNNECALVYSGESGAIHEGLSDIFGTMVEFWTANYKNLGRSPNYDIGEDLTTACGERRSLAYPESYCCPNTYAAGANWKDPTNLGYDNGGVHFNSGILNKWFYLVCEGGSGTNDLGNQYCVQGIGRDKASLILYETLRNYMTSTTNFNDLRFYTEYITYTSFGFSPDYHSVAAAWYAVGLDNIPTAANLPVDIHDKTETTNNNYLFNSRIQVYDYQENTSTVVNMSSNNSIHFFGEDPPQTVGATPKDIYIKSGSEFHAYIAPTCTGGARISNFNDNNVKEEKTDNFSKNILLIDSDFNISPNPNNGEFKINLNKETELPKSIIIRDLFGKEVKSFVPTEYEYNFELKDLKDGLYIINVIYDGKIASKKFVKQ